MYVHLFFLCTLQNVNIINVYIFFIALFTHICYKMMALIAVREACKFIISALSNYLKSRSWYCHGIRTLSALLALCEGNHHWPAGGRLNIKMSSYQYRIPMLKIRRSRDCLIFNMRIPIPGKDGLYIETGPLFPSLNQMMRIIDIFVVVSLRGCWGTDELPLIWYAMMLMSL